MPVEFAEDEFADSAGGRMGGILYDTENANAWVRSSRVVDLDAASPDGGTDDRGGDLGGDGAMVAPRYDTEADAYRIEYDWRHAPPIETVIRRTVGEFADRHPTDLPAIADVVGADTLDRLFSPRPDGSLGGDPIRFGLAGYEVCVRRHGHVLVRPPEAEHDR